MQTNLIPLTDLSAARITCKPCKMATEIPIGIKLARAVKCSEFDAVFASESDEPSKYFEDA